jgi:hypothetical protein
MTAIFITIGITSVLALAVRATARMGLKHREQH